MYFIKVQINNITFQAYIDTGSQINVAHISVSEKLALKLTPTTMLIKGFGNDFIKPVGTCNLLISTMMMSIESCFVFVSLELGQYDLIIGQPIINNENISFTVAGNTV